MPEKNCSRCKKLKPLASFCNSKLRTDGKHHECKGCTKELKLLHARTKKGLICKIYRNQSYKRKNRTYYFPEYSYKELFAWAINQQIFHDLYNGWEMSRYKKELAPSIDRIDCYKNYTFDNIQLMTWGENNKKGIPEKSEKNSKPVCQYKIVSPITKKYIVAVFMKRFESMTEASNKTGDTIASISNTCSGNQMSTRKYIWQYE